MRAVGFVLRDDGEVGGSPDRLVGEDGGLEIKNPAMHTHIGYLLDPPSLVADYAPQVQGYLYLTGRAWWDVLSYNPDLPPLVARVEPDAAFQAALDGALDTFLSELRDAKELLAEYRNPIRPLEAA